MKRARNVSLTQSVPGSIYLVAQITTLIVGASVLTNYWLNTESITVDAKELNRGLETTISPSPTLPVQKPEGVIPDTPIKRMIYSYFGESGLAVAKCESGFNPKAKNKESTAGGLFQILDGTWRAYKCTGDKFNPTDNVECAMKIYERNNYRWSTGGGWLASANCHKQP